MFQRSFCACLSGMVPWCGCWRSAYRIAARLDHFHELQPLHDQVRGRYSSMESVHDPICLDQIRKSLRANHRAVPVYFFLVFNAMAVYMITILITKVSILLQYLRVLVPHCISKVNFSVTAAFNVISDFCILIPPLHIIWDLQMKMRKKIGISLIFGTGAL